MQDKTTDSPENHTPLTHHNPEDDGQQEGAKSSHSEDFVL